MMRRFGKHGVVMLFLSVSLTLAAAPSDKVYLLSAYEFFVTNQFDRWIPSAEGRYGLPADGLQSGPIFASVHLPDGAAMIGYDMAYCREQDSPAKLSLQFLERCKTNVPCAADGASVTTSSTAIGCTTTPLLLEAHIIDNVRKQYFITGTFEGVTAPIQLTAVRIYYRQGRTRPVRP